MLTISPSKTLGARVATARSPRAVGFRGGAGANHPYEFETNLHCVISSRGNTTLLGHGLLPLVHDSLFIPKCRPKFCADTTLLRGRTQRICRSRKPWTIGAESASRTTDPASVGQRLFHQKLGNLFWARRRNAKAQIAFQQRPRGHLDGSALAERNLFQPLSCVSVAASAGVLLALQHYRPGSWLAPDQRNLLKSLDQKNRAPYAD